MKKIILITIGVIILIAGGWYLYSQQGTQQEQEEYMEDSDTSKGEETAPAQEEALLYETETDEKVTDEKDEETAKDNPYYEEKEVSAIPGPNEEIHKMSKSILASVFGEIKLTDTNSDSDPGDPKFDYTADYNYIVPEEINEDQAGQIREEIINEGGEITSTKVGSNYYRYYYTFEMDEKEYSANMGVFVGGEEELGDKPQTIDIDVRLNS